MKADTAQETGRGIGIERLRITEDIDDQRGPSVTATTDDIEAGANDTL